MTNVRRHIPAVVGAVFAGREWLHRKKRCFIKQSFMVFLVCGNLSKAHASRKQGTGQFKLNPRTTLVLEIPVALVVTDGSSPPGGAAIRVPTFSSFHCDFVPGGDWLANGQFPSCLHLSGNDRIADRLAGTVQCLGRNFRGWFQISESDGADHLKKPDSSSLKKSHSVRYCSLGALRRAGPVRRGTGRSLGTATISLSWPSFSALRFFFNQAL
jgi:hypothetical protein